MNSYKLWIHMIFSYMNSYVSWIHIWILVYQGSRCLHRPAGPGGGGASRAAETGSTGDDPLLQAYKIERLFKLSTWVASTLRAIIYVTANRTIMIRIESQRWRARARPGCQLKFHCRQPASPSLGCWLIPTRSLWPWLATVTELTTCVTLPVVTVTDFWVK